MSVTAKSSPAKSLRRDILDSARQVVIEEGYSGLSMRRIAREIGYSATSIYLHFENKDALLHALIEEGMDRLYGTLRRASNRAAKPREKVRAVCAAYANFGVRNPEYYEIMFMLHPEHMSRFPAEKYRRARRNLEVIEGAIEAALPKGRSSREDLRLSATGVWAALHGAVALLIARRVDVRIPNNRLVERVVDQIICGLGLE